MADLDSTWLREAVLRVATERAAAPMPVDEAFRAYLTGQMTSDRETDFRRSVFRRAGAYARMVELAREWGLPLPGLEEDDDEESPDPQVLLFPVRKLKGLRPLSSEPGELAALAAGGPDEEPSEPFTEGAISAVLVVEPGGLLVATVERDGKALSGAHLSLTLVTIGEGAKEVARGTSDVGGRVEFGLAAPFPPPTERQRYEVVVVCDANEA